MKFAQAFLAGGAVLGLAGQAMAGCKDEICLSVTTDPARPFVGEAFELQVGFAQQEEGPNGDDPFDAVHYATVFPVDINTTFLLSIEELGISNLEIPNSFASLTNGWAAMFDPDADENNDEAFFQSGEKAYTVNLTYSYLDGTGERVTSIGEYSHVTYQGWLSFLPLILLVFISFGTRNVYFGLFLGIWIANLIMNGANIKDSFFKVTEKYIVGAAIDEYHMLTIIFSVLLGGLTAVITKSGGAKGLATMFTQYATTSRMGQFITYVSGWLIFFDDYANAMVVGSTMRPIADLLNISREKLAFIVDATSAPIASLMPISAWIAFEIGQIEDQVAEIQKETKDDNAMAVLGLESDGYSLFLGTIPSRFYPFAMLFFQLTLILSGLEFGPMLTAERHARFERVVENAEEDEEIEKERMKLEQEDGMEPDADTPAKWWNGVVPIVVLIICVVVSIVQTGIDNSECDGDCTARVVFGDSDPFLGLVRGSLGGIFLTFIFYRFQYKEDGEWKMITQGGAPIISFNHYVDTIVRGIMNLVPAVIILVLAWSLGSVMKDIGAPRFFQSGVEDSISPGALPAVCFLLSALIALATGSSWTTMTIMFNLIGLLAYNKAVESGNDGALFLQVFSTVLSGSVFGDHCSPLSDTTILSSIATRCSVGAHVITQAPYAFYVATFTVLFGDLFCGVTGAGVGFGLILSSAAAIASVFFVAAPVNSSTGRIDVFNRIALMISSNPDDHKITEVASRAIASEETNPTWQFDPFGNLVGGHMSGVYTITAENELPKADAVNPEYGL